MRELLDTIGGLWELARLAAVNGLRLRGPYWRWRRETAFGPRPHEHLSRGERLRAVLEYGRWLYRIKRGR